MSLSWSMSQPSGQPDPVGLAARACWGCRYPRVPLWTVSGQHYGVLDGRTTWSTAVMSAVDLGFPLSTGEIRNPSVRLERRHPA